MNCTIDGCERAHRAKGLCSTHYNQTLPNRHAKVTKACDVCGTVTTKEDRTKRYNGSYCSLLCRDYDRWGGQSCTIPADHWARMYGATCKVELPRIYQCEWCNKDCASSYPDARYCDDTCRMRSKRARRRAREYGAHGLYTWAQITRLWIAFDRCCAYCRTPTPLPDVQAEHVVALARGGANNIGNLLPSCGPCNSDKRDLTLHAWATDRARRGLTPVITMWSHNDARYSHLTYRTDVRMSA